MLTARAADGKRIPAANDDGSKNTAAWCPCCGKPMVARVGTERRPHWAHKSAERCDEWWEVESEWHIEWRKRFLDAAKPNVKIEVEHVLEKDGSRHFSDVRIDDRLSIILRRARMDDTTKSERLSFFGDLIWLVQAKESEYNRLIRQRKEFELRPATSLKGCNVCVNADKSFFSSWKNARSLVVFDFRLAAKSNDEKLWVVLPGDGLRRNTVCLSVDEFIKRIVTTGNLFKKTIAEVNAEFEKRSRYPSDMSTEIACHFPSAIEQPPCRDSSPVSVRHEEATPSPVPNQDNSPARPKEEIWPEVFDRTVVLALTVDAVSGWLIANGRISELETESIIDGEAAATGCCAIHCSTRCSSPELYWAKRRIRDEHGGDVLSDVPQDYELKGMAGDFVGVVEYHVEERPSGRVRVHLRKCRKLNDHFSHRQSRECIWRLTPDLQSRFAASTPQDSVDAAAPPADMTI